MGILVHCSDIWFYQGSYSSFNKFKQAICYNFEGSFPPHDKRHPYILGEKLEDNRWYWNVEKYKIEEFPGLYSFLCCDDSGSSLSIIEMRNLKNELKLIYNNLSLLDITFTTMPGPFMISHSLGVGGMAQIIITACEVGIKNRRKLMFG